MSEGAGAGRERVRIDKWLWAARFYKTRSLAARAVEGGKVQVNGERVKPSRELKPGDAVVIHIGELAWVIYVRALSMRRGPAETARKLYAERDASRERRLAAIAARKRQPDPGFGIRGRPTKRDRRMIRRFSGED